SILSVELQRRHIYNDLSHKSLALHKGRKARVRDRRTFFATAKLAIFREIAKSKYDITLI
ncbi:MAG: hypothetical protein K2L89_01865, partial [Muribaculaceae bacterium]|nr:hypothetical protein [Muribaculaceae bacterium]